MHVQGSDGRHEIVDVCGVAFDAACWRAYFMNLAQEAPGYLDVFGARLCSLAGADEGEYGTLVRHDPRSAVDLLMDSGGLAVDFAAHVGALQAQGVTSQVLHGGMWKIDSGNVNDRLAELCAPYKRLQFWVGLSLRGVADALREVRRGHHELGARGVSIVPFLDGVDVLDPSNQPVFEYLERHQLPLWIHCGNNFAVSRPLDLCSWRHIDRLASRYPDLVLIVGHGGWPWIGEVAAVAQRHRDVLIDCSTHRGSRMARSGSGWEPVLARADTTLKHKLVFGSTTWTTGRSVRELADEMYSLNLHAETIEAWLGGNARRIFDLPGTV